MTEQERRAYTMQEVADMVGTSLDTIKKAASKGELEVRYPHRRPLITSKAIDEWLESLPTERV